MHRERRTQSTLPLATVRHFNLHNILYGSLCYNIYLNCLFSSLVCAAEILLRHCEIIVFLNRTIFPQLQSLSQGASYFKSLNLFINYVVCICYGCSILYFGRKFCYSNYEFSNNDAYYYCFTKIFCVCIFDPGPIGR